MSWASTIPSDDTKTDDHGYFLAVANGFRELVLFELQGPYYGKAGNWYARGIGTFPTEEMSRYTTMRYPNSPELAWSTWTPTEAGLEATVLLRTENVPSILVLRVTMVS